MASESSLSLNEEGLTPVEFREWDDPEFTWCAADRREHTWGEWRPPFNANKQTMDGPYSQPMKARYCTTCGQVQTREISLTEEQFDA